MIYNLDHNLNSVLFIHEQNWFKFNMFQKKRKEKKRKEKKEKGPWQPDSSGYWCGSQVLPQDDPWSKNDPWQLKQWFAFPEHVLHDGSHAIFF